MFELTCMAAMGCSVAFCLWQWVVLWRGNMSSTPGPWTLGDENNQCCEVVLGTSHNLTASLSRQDSNTGCVVIERDEMLANAKLIAAAPMMLNALRRIVRHQDCIGGSMDSISSTRHIAAQAIQHATGEVV